MSNQSKIKLLLIGGGGHCRACIDVIRSTQKYEIVGILDVTEKVGSQIDGVPIIGTDDELKTYIEQVDECLITVGQIGIGSLRESLYQRVLDAKGSFATVVSVTAIVADSVNISAGTIVMHQAIINAGAKIGANSILNSMSLVEHDACVGDHTHISTRATVNGDTTIGSRCFVGSHAVVFSQCTVGDECIVGGGQVIRHDLTQATQARHIASGSFVASKPVFIIAEAGVNHNGDLALAKKMIEIAAKAGADAVKFQTFRAEDLSTDYAEKAEYQKKATEIDSNNATQPLQKKQSQKDMLKELELAESDWPELINHCQRYDIEFMSTAFDIYSMDFLLKLGIRRIKIPSGELTNVPLLRHCASQGLPVILSTGMANLDEVFTAKSLLLGAGLSVEQLSILHCNTAYPTPFVDANIACVKTLTTLGCETGYSDHTLGDEAVIASIALGAVMVEKHFTLDRSLPGPDQATSLEPQELTQMVTRIRNIEQALGNGIKAPTESEINNISVARKSIVANQFIKAGEIFNEDNLTTKRPGNGVSAALWDDVIGETAQRDYAVDEQIEF